MLTSGTRLGPYEIDSLLASGGMGDVYKGRDTRLDRVVAIKVLPPALADDPVFRERFDREARTISQLTHPNICALYDVGEEPAPAATGQSQPSATSYLVMEFLEGETLATRLERGALKLEEALRIAGEIVAALDCAHEANVVHRDLKPGNVMLTRTGAKLLDFGLAKKAASAVAGRGAAAGPMIQSAASGAVTAEGMIVGTFQYMAPEQLEGAEPKARADIFAFGAILYEMVTGRKAFEGKTPVSLISAILKDEPQPVTSIIPVAPPALDRIIRACMAKDPDARLGSAHDLGLQLQWLAEGGSRTEAQPVSAPVAGARPAPGRTISTMAWLLAAVVGVAALAAGVAVGRRGRETPPPAEAVQFTVAAPDNSVLAAGGVPSFAISPDGRHIVFVATTPGSSSRLFLRSLGTLAVTPLPGTERATNPFWSPDSRFVAFFAAGKLRKVQVTDGSLIELCNAPNGQGGTWNQENVIVFAPTVNGALERVVAAGGPAAPATTIDSAHGETAHRWPHFLPDGRHFLYFAPSSGQQPSEVKVGALDSKDATTVVAAESMATYASGHVFFWRDGGLMAQPFDAEKRQVQGDPFRIAGPVGQSAGIGYASFAVSPTGVLVYARGNPRPPSQLTWMDRTGKQVGTAGEPGDYFNIALSPDERHVAVTRLTGTPENRDIWLVDLARSVTSRLTSDPANDILPLWSPDGARVLFGSVRDGATNLFLKSASGSQPEELLTKFVEGAPNAIDWSRDGKYVLYFNQVPKTGFDLMVLPLTGDRKPFPFQQTTFNETDGAFSPDTAWVAYTSDESGREEVYVQPFPTTGPKYRISANGGTEPTWRGDGRELFFLAPDGTVMAATVSTAKGFEAGTPQALFASGVAFTGNRHQYAVTRDGQRFLVNVPQPGSSPTPLTVVVNWQAAVQK
jgi:Tol biopolymer transport system component